MTSDIAVSVVAVVVVIALLLALLLAFLAHGRHDVDGRYGQQTSIAQPEEEMLATAEMVTGITLGAVTSGGQLIPKELVTEAQKERLALTGHPNTLETKASPVDVEPLGVESTEEENYQDHLATFVAGHQT